MNYWLKEVNIVESTSGSKAAHDPKNSGGHTNSVRATFAQVASAISEESMLSGSSSL